MRIPMMVLGVLALGLLSCAIPPGGDETWGELKAPMVLAERHDPRGVVEMDFDVEVSLEEASLEATGSARPRVLVGEGTTVAIDTNPGTSPGEAYAMSLRVEDRKGNQTAMVLPFHGPNPDPATLVINEVGAKSSTTIRDFVELRVTDPGNLAGLTLYLGTPADHEARVILPALRVEVGDLVVIHAKPEGIPEEVDEGEDRTLSGGKNAEAGALDLWLREAPGLGDASGVLVLTNGPLGPVMDALFYTDKVTEEGKDYRSFGTKGLLGRAEWLETQAAWPVVLGPIAVEDGARSSGTTATRTLNRLADPGTGKEYWYVTASGGASPGRANNPAVHQAP